MSHRVSVGFPILFLFLWGDPFQRGFFCNDLSLRHPYHESTVPSIYLYIVGLVVNSIVVSPKILEWCFYETCMSDWLYNTVYMLYRNFPSKLQGCISSVNKTDITWKWLSFRVWLRVKFLLQWRRLGRVTSAFFGCVGLLVLNFQRSVFIHTYPYPRRSSKKTTTKKNTPSTYQNTACQIPTLSTKTIDANKPKVPYGIPTVPDHRKPVRGGFRSTQASLCRRYLRHLDSW